MLELYEKAIDLDNKVGEKIGLEIRQGVLLQMQLETNGTFQKRILNDRILLEMRVFTAERHHKLFDLIDRKMQQIFEGGLFFPFTARLLMILDKKRFPLTKEAFKVLTFDELEAGFVICFASLLFGVSAFCLEWIVLLKDKIIVQRIFEGFFEIHREQFETQSENLGFKITVWEIIAKERHDNFLAAKMVAIWKKKLEKRQERRSTTKSTDSITSFETDDEDFML